jgi:Fur family ferric uptake transcriptional regulator
MIAADAAPPLRLRSAGVRLAGDLARLHASLFDAAAWDAASFRRLLADPTSIALLAGPAATSRASGRARSRDGPLPAWGLIVGRVAADEAEILTLGVAGDRRRLGIARRLVERLCEVAAERGAWRLYLEVAEGNSAARALYARLGFREVGRRPGYYVHAGAPPEDAINLCLGLGACATACATVDAPRGVAYNRTAIHSAHADMRASTQPANRIEKLCADKRLRMTGQRRVIARVLAAAKDHPDVEEVHRRAHAADARISLSTVYRTLRLFATKGILERHDFGAGRGRYEAAARSHHDHLIDIETGRVIEFSNEEIERLQQRVAQELGFDLVGHRLELYGVPARRPRK